MGGSVIIKMVSWSFAYNSSLLPCIQSMGSIMSSRLDRHSIHSDY